MTCIFCRIIARNEEEAVEAIHRKYKEITRLTLYPAQAQPYPDRVWYEYCCVVM